jgi:hypothetical protein
MSILGQKQTSAHVRVMSALPPKADIEAQWRDVRFVPKADIDPKSLIDEDYVPAPSLGNRAKELERPQRFQQSRNHQRTDVF